MDVFSISKNRCSDTVGFVASHLSLVVEHIGMRLQFLCLFFSLCFASMFCLVCLSQSNVGTRLVFSSEQQSASCRMHSGSLNLGG